MTAASACGDDGGSTMGDSAAAYCSADDTIYISQKFATDIYDGALDQALPGSSQGYGRTVGDFAVAYIVAHEYGHQIQDELGLFERYGSQLPTMAFELQADCFAGTWAHSAYQENRLEQGDVQEALDAALAVGDFDAGNPGHHGTPEQRADAWNSGFESGNPVRRATATWTRPRARSAGREGSRLGAMLKTFREGQLVSVATEDGGLDGVVAHVTSLVKVEVAVDQAGSGPVFRTVHPKSLTPRDEPGPSDDALRRLIHRAAARATAPRAAHRGAAGRLTPGRPRIARRADSTVDARGGARSGERRGRVGVRLRPARP